MNGSKAKKKIKRKKKEKKNYEGHFYFHFGLFSIRRKERFAKCLHENY